MFRLSETADVSDTEAAARLERTLVRLQELQKQE
jgi:hypothetical protein